MSQPWKVCGCGRSWPTREAYESDTVFVGVQSFDGASHPLALRNCVCRSTLCEPVPFVLNERVLGIREALSTAAGAWVAA